jgi:hypothetical protein
MRSRIYMHSCHLWRYFSSLIFNVPGERTEQVSSFDKAPNLFKKYRDPLSAGSFPRFTLELERRDRHIMRATRDVILCTSQLVLFQAKALPSLRYRAGCSGLSHIPTLAYRNYDCQAAVAKYLRASLTVRNTNVSCPASRGTGRARKTAKL